MSVLPMMAALMVAEIMGLVSMGLVCALRIAKEWNVAWIRCAT